MIKKISFFSLALIISGVIIFACNKSNEEDNGGNNNGGNNGGNNTSGQVSITGMSFAAVTVKEGTTVKWTNNDNTSHTVTADDDSFDSGDIAPGASYSHTFSTAGSYPYHCVYHSMMKATVTVTAN